MRPADGSAGKNINATLSFDCAEPGEPLQGLQQGSGTMVLGIKESHFTGVGVTLDWEEKQGEEPEAVIW